VQLESDANFARVTDGAEAIIARALDALAGTGSSPLVFNAAPFARAGVPGLGAGEAVGAATPVMVTRDERGVTLRNELVEVVISAEGLITSAIDLATGRDAIAPGGEANLLQLHQDFPNMWDAWDVDRYYRNRVDDLRALDALTVSEDAEGVHVRIERSFSSSRVSQVLTLEPGSRVLRIEQSTDWHETEKFLKVAFPLDVRAEHTAAETQFGYYKRVTHTNTSWEAAKFETSMHRFVLAQEPGFGVALVTDSTYGYDMTRDADEGDVTTTLRLSLLRAPRFPDPETDQGVQTHAYGMVIGTDALGATEAGIALNTASRARLGAGSVEPLAAVAGDGILISSVKLAHDRSGDLIVRVYEAQGRRASGVVSVGAPFGAGRAVSLIEDEAGEDAARGGAAVEVALTPFEVRTLRFSRV